MKALNQGYFLRKNAKDEYYAFIKGNNGMTNTAYMGFVAGGSMAEDEEKCEAFINEAKDIQKKNLNRKK